MALVVENRLVSENIYLLTVEGVSGGRCGQFYMLKPNGTMDPLLGRPISIFDVNEEKCQTSFLYHVVGKGTVLLSELRPGMQVQVNGPYGNGFTLVDEDMTIIGGGIGIAPLLLLAKKQKEKYPHRQVNAYLGFTRQPYLMEAFSEVVDIVQCNIGGYITDDVPFSNEGVYVACGPMPMMRAAAQRAKENNSLLYVSLESKMACGVGACLGCSCKTEHGNRCVCKDGPVFLASEVFYE